MTWSCLPKKLARALEDDGNIPSSQKKGWNSTGKPAEEKAEGAGEDGGPQQQ